MRGKLSFIQGNLTLLKEMNWIDRQTRAVFVEFSVYNPNINLIMVSTILVEFLPSGTLFTSARFDPLNLFGESGQTIFSFKILCEIVFMGFIVYFLIIEVKNFLNKGLKSYWSEFWSYLEWSIIATAFISFGMFLIRLKTAQEVLDFFKTTGGYGYLKLQKVNDCNQTLTFSLGVCSALGTIKILKMLQFNRNISLLSATLRRCFSELASFTLFFFLLWFSFVQLMYFIYGSHLRGFASLIKSMESAILIMLGKSNASEFIQAYSILGPLIYSMYNVIILLFALNIFISIITDAFDALRTETKKKPNDFDLINYLRFKLKKCFFKKNLQDSVLSAENYKDHLTIFPIYIDRLNRFITRVSILIFFVKKKKL
jgi:hypothetical protein